METCEILKAIFNHNFESKGKSSGSNLEKRLQYFEQVNTWVNEQLDKIGTLSQSIKDRRPGRFGPDLAQFDISSHFGLFIISSEKLSIHSQSNFSSILCNVCVYQGKWQFEVQLGTKGVMQIGWATRSCRFSQETGVGDTNDSYAYDGNRVRKWNGYTQKYGQPWLSGDIIGCCADFDSGTMIFYRNGESMGEAFDSVHIGPGRAYFPAVSLGFGEHLVANFGNTPFRYPVQGYEPIQLPPTSLVRRCDQVLNWFLKFLVVFEQSKSKVGQTKENEISNEAFFLSMSRVLTYSLATLLPLPYITEACFLPFIESISEINDTAQNKKKVSDIPNFGSKLHTFLDVLWAYFDEMELKCFLENICSQLLSKFRHVPTTLDYDDQKKNLNLLRALCEHSRTRQMLLKNIFFDSVKFVEFLHVKMLDEPGLISVIDKPWWDSHGADKDVEDRKKPYLKSCNRLLEAISSVETLQVELLKTLMINTDGSSRQPSSRKIFLKRLRIFFHDHYMATRSLPLLQTPLPVTLCCFHRLISAFQDMWSKEMPKTAPYIQPRSFYDGSINYYTIDRVGGVLSHLMKTYRSELENVLGPDHEILSSKVEQENPSSGRLIPPMDIFSVDGQFPGFLPGPSIAIRIPQDAQPTMLPSVVPVLARLIQQANAGTTRGLMFDSTLGNGGDIMATVLKADKSRVSSGQVHSSQSLIELLDGLILFYHTSAHKQIVKVSAMRDNMEDYILAYEGTRTRLMSFKNPTKSMKRDSSVFVQNELQNACQVFETKLYEQARFMAWVRAAIFSQEKQGHLVWLLKIILQTAKTSSNEGGLFSFLPEFYMDTLFELVSALRTHIHPTCTIEEVEGYNIILKDVAEYLCLHFSDSRIVNAATKDTVVQALAQFVAAPVTLHALEKIPIDVQRHMVTGLLRPYENRAWAQSNWVLVRFWQGCGFAFRYDKSPHLTKKNGPKFIQSDSTIINQSIAPLPSKIYQNHVKEIMINDEPMASSFINSLLNQLNWSFSEFIGMLQEIQNISSRPERVYIESRQLRICSTCFDLSLALLRVLEMVASIAPLVFTDSNRPNSELLFSRLCQLLCQILNRVSCTTGCFQHIVMLEIPDLEAIDHFPILAAVIGILLALFRKDMKSYKENNPVSPLAKILLTEPSFQLQSLTFVLGDIQHQVEKGKPQINKFSLLNYKGDVTDEEINDVKLLIKFLEGGQRKVSVMSLHSDDDVCTICYAYPVSVIFEPCHHQSCKVCIGHHLLNGRECFFCKAIIERVVDLQGVIIHDLGSSND